MVAYLQSKISHFYYFTPDTPLPVTVDYRSPKTLGSDRIAAVIGARAEAPDRDILVIDAGTCITYDMITATGHFLGGNIAPGIKMRLRSMNKFTEKLPVVEKNGDTPLLGYDTETAMRSGAILGACYEIEGYIRSLTEKNVKISIIFTGGDAKYFVKRIKNAIFAKCELVICGLNRILDYNATEQADI